MISILDCAPSNITLREPQKEALLFIEKNYHEKQFLMLNLPTGDGKSIIVATTMEWIRRNNHGPVAAITPTKILQDQYTSDFPDILMLKGMSNYECLATPAGNCQATKRLLGNCCGGGSCGYVQTVQLCKLAPKTLYNFHSYYFNEMWKNNIVIDEAHNSIPFLFEIFGVKLWQPEWGFDPDTPDTPEAIAQIVGSAIESLKDALAIATAKKIEAQINEISETISKYEGVSFLLKSFSSDTLIVKKQEEYKGKIGRFRGTKQIVFYIKPLRVSTLAEKILWPRNATKKIILTSATLGLPDAYELGISDDKLGFFQSEGTIPPERRPFVVYPVVNMSYAHQSESSKKLIEVIKQLAEKHKQHKGIIHCTYGVGQILQKVLSSDPRFIFHDNKNKNEVYRQFRASKGNSVLVASGMSEGIDLPGDMARWQVITKVMWPSLADDVNAWRSHNAPDLYRWDTVKTTIQQSGRVCRGPDDFGVTYMLDKSFTMLWNVTKNKNMWPKWFVKSMIWVKTD